MESLDWIGPGHSWLCTSVLDTSDFRGELLWWSEAETRSSANHRRSLSLGTASDVHGLHSARSGVVPPIGELVHCRVLACRGCPGYCHPVEQRSAHAPPAVWRRLSELCATDRSLSAGYFLPATDETGQLDWEIMAHAPILSIMNIDAHLYNAHPYLDGDLNDQIY